MKKNKSVFSDLGFNEQEALALTVKADLYGKILDVVEKKKIKPRELEKMLVGVITIGKLNGNTKSPMVAFTLTAKLAGEVHQRRLTIS